MLLLSVCVCVCVLWHRQLFSLCASFCRFIASDVLINCHGEAQCLATYAINTHFDVLTFKPETDVYLGQSPVQDRLAFFVFVCCYYLLLFFFKHKKGFNLM